jgi:MFS family permease
MEKTKSDSYLKHWLTVLACSGLMASALGIAINCTGVFYVPVSTDLGCSVGTYTMTATLTSLTAGLLSPLVVKVIAKYPIRPVLTAGVLLTGVSTALSAAVSDIWLFYVLSVIKGFGLSFFLMLTVTTILGKWFRKKYGFVVGIAMALDGVAGAIMNPVFSSLIVSIGWRMTYVVMGIVTVAFALPGALLLRMTPEEVGLRAYGAEESDVTLKEEKNTPKQKLKLTPALFILFFMILLANLSVGLMQHFSGYSENIGLGATTGALMVSAAMIGNIVFKIIIGLLGDKYGSYTACIIMTSLVGLSIAGLLLLNSDSYILAYISAFLYGAIFAIGAVGAPLLTRSVSGDELYPSAYAFVNIVGFIGNAIGLTGTGMIYDMTGTYTPAFMVGLVFQVMCIVCILIIKKMNMLKKT